MAYDKQKLTIIVLSVLLVLSIGYIAYGQFQQSRSAQVQDISQRAYYAGVYDTISSLYKQTDSCNVATVNFVNVTRQVVDINCIKNSAQNKAQ